MESTLLLLEQASQPANGSGGLTCLAILAACLGVAGFFLAMLSLAWQVWTHRQATRPKLGAHATLRQDGDNTGEMYMEVWNIGRMAVYINEVAVEYSKSEPLRPGSVDATALGGSFELYCQGDGTEAEPLAPFQSRAYMRDIAASRCRALAKLPKDSVSVAVRAAGRVLLRIPGRDVHWIVEGIAGKGEAEADTDTEGEPKAEG